SVFAVGGSISGTIAGGTGGTDGFAVDDGTTLHAYQPLLASGTATFHGVTVTYTGMEAFSALTVSGGNVAATGSIFDRSFTVAVGANVTVTFAGLSFGNGAAETSAFSVATSASF